MPALITIEGLEKTYATLAGELRILKGINAVFQAGEMVSIIGASGVGKSTFLHLLGTLDKPTAGKVLYNVTPSESLGPDKESGHGIDPFTLSNGDLAIFRNRVIGFVFQFHYLLPEFSALENVAIPGLISISQTSQVKTRKELYGRAESLLDELGLYKRKNHKPGELSGGEQQRVAVARALIQEPKVVLADEPTGNLDVTTGEELFRLLTDINASRGVTFIIVTHNPSLSKRCQRTLEMTDGRLTEQ